MYRRDFFIKNFLILDEKWSNIEHVDTAEYDKALVRFSLENA